MRGPRQDSQAGFTLLEAMVALAIIALVITSYLGIRTTALLDGIEARNWRLARELAEEKMSELLAGARENQPESGVAIDFEKYKGFAYKIVIGEANIGELDSQIADAAAADDEVAGERAQWQRNRELYRKASASGKSYTEYQDQVAQEEYQRQLQEKAPSETELEDVAVAVLFPKLNAKYEGQKEAFVIKAKVSTLALTGLTPDQAKQVAESKGQTSGSAGSSGGGGTGDGGGKQ